MALLDALNHELPSTFFVSAEKGGGKVLMMICQ